MATDKPHPEHEHAKGFDWKIFVKPSVLSVFALVIAWNLVTSSEKLGQLVEGPGAALETIREFRDLNLHIQMRLYQFLFRYSQPIDMPTEDIRLVYINDDIHWMQYYGDEPTNRAFLESLVTNASDPKTKARAIGIDVELLAPKGTDAGSDEQTRLKDDNNLLIAIQKAADNGVPVILAAVYRQDEKDQLRMLDNIYANESVLTPLKHDKSGTRQDCLEAACPVFGYINLPSDKRVVPLAKEVVVAKDEPAVALPSFAQALAEAAQQPRALHRQVIPANSETDKEEPTFGSFLPEENPEEKKPGDSSTPHRSSHAFKNISASRLSLGTSDAKNECAGKIVIIGGHWHQLEGFGERVDMHLSPAGSISGMGLHANYVESLLHDRTAHEWPTLVDMVIDLLFGLGIYTLFEIAAHTWWKISLLLLVGSCLPLVVAYFSLVNLHVYLDFVLPLELYFLHIVYELVYEAIKEHIKHEPAEVDAAHHP